MKLRDGSLGKIVEQLFLKLRTIQPAGMKVENGVIHVPKSSTIAKKLTSLSLMFTKVAEGDLTAIEQSEYFAQKKRVTDALENYPKIYFNLYQYERKVSSMFIEGMINGMAK